MTVSREEVLACLKKIQAPSGVDLVEAGLVRALTVADDAVRFVMEVDAPEPFMAAKAEAEEKLNLLGCSSVSIVMTAHSKPTAPPNLQPSRKAEPAGPEKIPGIDRIIAVASGKGGVGKSTDGKIILPLRNFGVTMMSIGLMTNEDQAVVWRGPMLMGALQQMLTQVQWGALDVLIVDLPPGTGDVNMTLAQKSQVDGAIIVSTPQDVALMDARKGIDMFNQLGTPIIGMIENMSTHICSACGHEEHVFGHGGVKSEAEKLGVPLLAEIPLHLDIRIAADGGAPIVVSKPNSSQAQAFRTLAKNLIESGQA
jgi:ATP-binding protein involved in chromosome partitioning